MKKNLKMGLIDTIYYFLSKLFPGISGLLCIAIYTRMVGIENYGIYIPTQEELISYQRNEEEIRKELQVDYLIYNSLDKIIATLKQMNNSIKDFEISMFL